MTTPSVSFAEFQASGVAVADLSAIDHIGNQLGCDGPMPGRVYANDALYIEGTPGNYCLTIGNHSESSDDLERLERQLYEFAVSEEAI